MGFIKKSFTEKQHLLIKPLLVKFCHFYVVNVRVILLNEFIIWMKQGFFTGIFYILFIIILTTIKLRNFFFCRLEPDQTLATKCISEQKKNKERLSIALCANADGSRKLDLLIIEKFAKPQCFKNININCRYIT
jgi:hypothetical protein